ncbi:farnesol dehydrogenase-like isoform X2 [Zootermopsis nevadensis]|uniref:Dehydrogenase/reductase SDR family member 11 n=2 Tax=Zootermopsis nevadensis TaxID=136037 RepID=A0A067R7J2_ZOONE|nr:farnesol dehydrogenase-like isoform X2 [Zootermopsis nevadensis]XP_021929728.1 farnesol dehydrogenase-like isoform X2 [Zootermopsis nevadensis]XP_021929729.1 farnesol dehydrogenase-like isoform X2 [Zootermopsis nevadensis]KDR14275.1 Dehydrogenase/reductase SDR family member 11 [Zootermopsis nevadensis]
MERWSGRVALVTGASAGIGAATAEELVKKGLKVVGLARRVEKIEELAESLKSAPGKLYALKCDVTKESEVQAAFEWIKTKLGGVDILINNAGTASNSKLISGPVEKWRKIFDLNVLGLSLCTKEALKSMKERGVDDGHIVHINSIVGHTIPHSDLVDHMYCASKHAVTALTEGLRRELVKQNSKIRVTSVSPGMVATEFMAASGRPVDPEQVYGSHPHLVAKDVADAILYSLGVPQHVQIHELTIKPVGETF